MLLEHLQKLGLKLNTEKSVLVPRQSIMYLGLSLDSVTFRAQLSEERIIKFYAMPGRILEGKQYLFSHMPQTVSFDIEPQL